MKKKKNIQAACTLIGGLLLAAALLFKGATATNPPCGAIDGLTIDAMETVGDWVTMSGNGAISATLTTVTGTTGQAVQMSYNLGTTKGAWVQLRRDFSPPLDLSSADHLRFFYQGTAINTLEIGLVVSSTNYFGTSWNEITHVPVWRYATWDLQDFGIQDFSQVQAIFISVVNTENSAGGVGSFTIDELQTLDIASRPIPTTEEKITVLPTITQQAAQWIADQQQENGLLRSWPEEYESGGADYAWLYDQALGLIVLAEAGYSVEAAKLFTTLHSLQNENGSWNGGFRYLTNPITSIQPASQPVGANAWLVYALTRYSLLSGQDIAYADAKAGAAWLAALQRPDGSVPAIPGESSAPTEPNLDVWWAFQATGYQEQADLIRDYLLNQVWDDHMGRFKSDKDQYHIFLDNQTWGAAFLQGIGRVTDARRALSYAQWTLSTTSFDGSVCGFDGAGPFSVWNEGTLQYIAAHGENSQFYWAQTSGQQTLTGGLPGSPDNFGGYIVWLTQWPGIAPTAWLYFAGTEGPFYVTQHVFLPVVIK